MSQYRGFAYDALTALMIMAGEVVADLGEYILREATNRGIIKDAASMGDVCFSFVG